ncbi:hypothetical protein RFI_31401 [Reticulomyxa filosa]|uniref:Uncharacterized protein n=1 Tax=Reticulomyxa filosa TaxID=46433 RepID=X6LWK6_RETFI|nr:hypothetical protein RFI_31401 [Reticulomyxa filosa]|eukprot:ETO05994.1 hypothetical protein RFI_31401 [Reticulomyxa filosa]
MSGDDGGLQGLKALTDLLENHLKKMVEQESFVEFAIVNSGENASLLREAKDKALKDEKDLLKSLQVLELSDFLKNCVLVERMYDELYAPLRTEQKGAREKYAKSLAEYEKT